MMIIKIVAAKFGGFLVDDFLSNASASNTPAPSTPYMDNLPFPGGISDVSSDVGSLFAYEDSSANWSGDLNRGFVQKPHEPHAAFWHCAKPHLINVW